MTGIYYSPKPGRLSKHVTWSLLEAHVQRVAIALNRESWQPDIIVGVFQGGWIVAQLLADFFPSANVIGATSKRKDGQFRSVLLSTEDDASDDISDVLKNKMKIIIVDEVVESGRTLDFHKVYLEKVCDVHAEIRTACIFAFEGSSMKPNYVAEMTDQDVSFILPWRERRDAPTTAGHK